jgi:threonine synthase
MTMQFFSTRDQNRKVTSSQAIAQGLSDEGGLFVPESFPQVDVKALCGLDYPALAAAVVREYLTDYDPAFLTEATRSTYGAAFGGKAGYLAPVEGDTYARLFQSRRARGAQRSFDLYYKVIAREYEPEQCHESLYR